MPLTPHGVSYIAATPCAQYAVWKLMTEIRDGELE